MNRIKRWLERRRNRKASDAINKRAIEEQRKQVAEERLHKRRTELKQHVVNISDDLEKIGFKTNEKYATGDEPTQATLVAVGPDKRVYVLTVYEKGGYNLRRP